MSIQLIRQYHTKVAYKEQVIDLLRRVCAVSVETMKIISQMPEE